MSLSSTVYLSRNHSLPYAKPNNTTNNNNNNNNDTMSSAAVVDEKHTDTASVRSTSTLSSLKSLLHKHSSSLAPKPKPANKANKKASPKDTQARADSLQARAVYFANR
jgi:hypothetical protein